MLLLTIIHFCTDKRKISSAFFWLCEHNSTVLGFFSSFQLVVDFYTTLMDLVCQIKITAIKKDCSHWRWNQELSKYVQTICRTLECNVNVLFLLFGSIFFLGFVLCLSCTLDAATKKCLMKWKDTSKQTQKKNLPTTRIIAAEIELNPVQNLIFSITSSAVFVSLNDFLSFYFRRLCIVIWFRGVNVLEWIWWNHFIFENIQKQKKMLYTM